MTSPPRSATTPAVGVPIHERVLVTDFLSQYKTLVRPGPGRSVFVIEEAELGAGRPDLIFVTMPSGAFDRFRQSGLRLTSMAAARVLDPSVPLDHVGVTRSYAMSLRRSHTAQGWDDFDVTRLADLVADTYAIEAKMYDWRRAVQQVSRFRRHFHRSAILMPRRNLPPEADRTLDFYGCGVLFRNGDSFRVERDPAVGVPSVAARLWTLELLLRGMESGDAYRLSDFRNTSIASR